MKFNNTVKEILEWYGNTGNKASNGLPQSRTAGPASDGPASNPNGMDLKEYVITNGKETMSFDTEEERDAFMADNYGWKPKEIRED